MNSTTQEIEKFLQINNFKKIFVLCGEKSYITSGAKNFFQNILLKYNKKIYYKKLEIPTFTELKEITNKIKNYEPDLIIAVGGGTVIDYAKIANVIELEPNTEDLISSYSCPLYKKHSKLVAIPTTAGSGAEATSSAVIYINDIKYSLESEILKPDNFFLISDFLISAPKKVKASAGFDAIAQSIESLLSRKSNIKSVNYASEALEILNKNYISFINEPCLETAKKMSYASNLAGKAICISRTGAPHAVSYPFTSLFNISHGHAVSLFFEKIINFNYLNLKKSDTPFDLKERFNLIFKIMDVENINELNEKILQIKKHANLEHDLAKLKIDIKKNVNQILKGINLLRLKNNPVEISENDIAKIILG